MNDQTSHIQPTPSAGAADDITTQVSPAPPPSEQPDYSPSAFALPKQSSLRLWPGIVVIVLMWLGMKGPVWITDHYGDPNWSIPIAMLMFYGMFMGPMVAAVLLSIWWLFFSRLRWWERPLILFSCAAFGAGAYFLYHESVGAFGVIMFALPAVLTAWVGWLLVASFLSWPLRRAGLLVILLLAWGSFALVRFDGVTGSMKMDLSWRWSQTAEERFLAHRATRQKSAEAQALAEEKTPDFNPGDWPAFRGPNRDGQLKGVRIATDWDKNPPKELWRHLVGPGWGSFTVIGDRFYTQEQRGDKEVVVCYSVQSGDEVWVHEDKTRFNEVVGGPGPRATPTFHDGKIYALGANGTLNCLDAATGELKWQRDVAADTGAKVPQWGFASSPLVAHGLVSVFAGGPDGKSVVAYDIKTAEPKWRAGDGQLGYCSPQLSKLHGIEQILISTDAGVTAIHPTTGEILWKHSWQAKD
jgi:outer membrane protein assembly factor BamB